MPDRVGGGRVGRIFVDPMIENVVYRVRPHDTEVPDLSLRMDEEFLLEIDLEQSQGRRSCRKYEYDTQGQRHASDVPGRGNQTRTNPELIVH